VNLLGDNKDTINKNIETLTVASKEVGLEINVERAKDMLMSRDQNAVQNRDIKIANRSFLKCDTFQIFGNYSNKSTFDSERN
jgi:hypothetical protein